MAKLTIRTERCKGCGLCVNACPKHLLALAQDKINPKGHHPLEIAEMDKCVGCAFCGTMFSGVLSTVER